MNGVLEEGLEFYKVILKFYIKRVFTTSCFPGQIM